MEANDLVLKHSELYQSIRLTREEKTAIARNLPKGQEIIHFIVRSNVRFNKINKDNCLVAISNHFVLCIRNNNKDEAQSNKESNSSSNFEVVCKDLHISDIKMMAYSERDNEVLVRTDSINFRLLSDRMHLNEKFAQILYRNYQIVYSNDVISDHVEFRADDLKDFPEIHIHLSPSQKFQFLYNALCSKYGAKFHQDAVKFIHALVLSEMFVVDLNQLPMDQFADSDDFSNKNNNLVEKSKSNDLQPLFQAMGMMKFVCGVCCSGPKGSKILEVIKNFPEHFKRLQIIHITDCGSTTGLTGLLKALGGKKPQLTLSKKKSNKDIEEPSRYWNISGNQFEETDFHSFIDLLAISKERVVFLDVSNCGIGPSNAKLFFVSLANNKYLHHIQQLHVAGMGMNNDSFDAFNFYIRSLTEDESNELETLDIGNTKEGLKNYLDSLNSSYGNSSFPLTTLILAHSVVDQEAADALINFITRSKTLKCLDMSGTHVKAEDFADIILAIDKSGLEDFDLRMNRLNLKTGNLLPIFRAFLSSNLDNWKALSFDGNEMDLNDLKNILPLLKMMPNLTSLSLNDNFDDSMENIDTYLPQLLQIPSLKSISISCTGFVGEEPEDRKKEDDQKDKNEEKEDENKEEDNKEEEDKEEENDKGKNKKGKGKEDKKKKRWGKNKDTDKEEEENDKNDKKKNKKGKGKGKDDDQEEENQEENNKDKKNKKDKGKGKGKDADKEEVKEEEEDDENNKGKKKKGKDKGKGKGKGKDEEKEEDNEEENKKDKKKKGKGKGKDEDKEEDKEEDKVEDDLKDKKKKGKDKGKGKGKDEDKDKDKEEDNEEENKKDKKKKGKGKDKDADKEEEENNKNKKNKFKNKKDKKKKKGKGKDDNEEEDQQQQPTETNESSIISQQNTPEEIKKPRKPGHKLRSKLIPFINELTNHKNIINVDLSGNESGDEGYSAIISFIHSSNTVESISFDKNEPESIVLFETLAKEIDAKPQIVSFDFPVNDAKNIISLLGNNAVNVIRTLSTVQLSFVNTISQHRKNKGLVGKLPFETTPAIKKLIFSISQYAMQIIKEDGKTKHSRICEEYGLPLPYQQMGEIVSDGGTVEPIKDDNKAIYEKLKVYDTPLLFSAVQEKFTTNNFRKAFNSENNPNRIVSFGGQDPKKNSIKNNNQRKRSGAQKNPDLNQDNNNNNNNKITERNAKLNPKVSNENDNDENGDSDDLSPNNRAGSGRRSQKSPANSRRSQNKRRDESENSDEEDSEDIPANRRSRGRSQKSPADSRRSQNKRRDESEDSDEEDSDDVPANRRSRVKTPINSRRSQNKRRDESEDSDEEDSDDVPANRRSRARSQKSPANSRRSQNKRRDESEDSDEEDSDDVPANRRSRAKTPINSRRSQNKRSDDSDEEDSDDVPVNRRTIGRSQKSPSNSRRSANKRRDESEDSDEEDSDDVPIRNQSRGRSQNQPRNSRNTRNSRRDDESSDNDESDSEETPARRNQSRGRSQNLPKNSRSRRQVDSEDESEEEDSDDVPIRNQSRGRNQNQPRNSRNMRNSRRDEESSGDDESDSDETPARRNQSRGRNQNLPRNSRNTRNSRRDEESSGDDENDSEETPPRRNQNLPRNSRSRRQVDSEDESEDSDDVPIRNQSRGRSQNLPRNSTNGRRRNNY